MDSGAWRSTVPGVAKGWTWLSDFTFLSKVGLQTADASRHFAFCDDVGWVHQRPWPSGFQVQERNILPRPLMSHKATWFALDKGGGSEVRRTVLFAFFPWCGGCDNSGQNEWPSAWILSDQDARNMLVDKEHEQEINWLCKPTESFRHLSLLQHSLAYPDYVICVVQRKMKIQRPLLKKKIIQHFKTVTAKH